MMWSNSAISKPIKLSNGQKRLLRTTYTGEAHFFSEGLPLYNIYMCLSVPNKIVLTFWARSERHPVGLALDKTWKLAVSTAEHFTKGNLICISWNLNLDFSKFSTRFCCINNKPRFSSMQGYQDLNFCDFISAILVNNSKTDFKRKNPTYWFFKTWHLNSFSIAISGNLRLHFFEIVIPVNYSRGVGGNGLGGNPVARNLEISWKNYEFKKRSVITFW